MVEGITQIILINENLKNLINNIQRDKDGLKETKMKVIEYLNSQIFTIDSSSKTLFGINNEFDNYLSQYIETSKEILEVMSLFTLKKQIIVQLLNIIKYFPENLEELKKAA